MESIYQSTQQYSRFYNTRLNTGGSNSLRSGDWICLNCHNFNYSFRNICNRCKQQSKTNNIELQNIKKMMETNKQENKSNPSKIKKMQPAAPKIWFSQALYTQSFSNALLIYISESATDGDFCQFPLNHKVSMSQSVENQGSDDDRSSNSSKPNSLCCETWSIWSEKGCDQKFQDQYLLNILKD